MTRATGTRAAAQRLANAPDRDARERAIDDLLDARARHARDDRILRLPEVLARVGYGRTTLYKLISRNRFPRPLHLSENVTGWRASDVDRWIAERVNPTEAARR